ncbi:helix-turn-helix domain protein [Clostridium tepidiprofundi DSM 19306]|uniref:Helix-turn-helix domain protein n=1 Tax=Clostridium tepidiprofundi DSM 19306 TaxID=1121338 RepID=A0A151B660_9CLOT|nr:helix-turn-helix domain-containing protein [Clostridium tepidiprofundi]KYH35379.1 helix-turn-helix domain protein [Clostridium tepidiprofundi DSM 19306]
MKVKIARIKKGLTQTEMRKKLKEEYSVGMSPNKIVAIEKGDYTRLRYCEMIAISKALETPVQELFF